MTHEIDIDETVTQILNNGDAAGLYGLNFAPKVKTKYGRPTLPANASSLITKSVPTDNTAPACESTMHSSNR